MSKKKPNNNATISQLLKRIEILEEEVKCLSHTVSFLSEWRQDIVGKTTKELLDKEFYLGWHIPNQRIIENPCDYLPKEIEEEIEPLIDRFTKEENGTAKERNRKDYQRKSNEYECKQLESLPDEKLNFDIAKYLHHLATPEHKEAEKREYDYWKKIRIETEKTVKENGWQGFESIGENEYDYKIKVSRKDIDEIKKLLTKVREINTDIDKENV